MVAFPGYVPDVHAADDVDPAWGNAVRDRAPQVFATKALRDAAIPSPQVGQVCIITAAAVAGDEGIYVYHGATVGWTPPWNRQWGPVPSGRTVLTTSQSNANSSENTIAGLATTCTLVANRRYRITLTGMWRNLNAAVQTLTLRIKDGSTLIETGRAWVAPANASGPDVPVSFSVEATGLSAGSHTFNVTQQSGNASGVNCGASGYAAVLVVEDIGPNGAPS